MAEESSAAVHICPPRIPLLRPRKKAKVSLLYVYKHAASGFSAKLTPEQVAELSMKGLMSLEDDGGLASSDSLRE